MGESVVTNGQQSNLQGTFAEANTGLIGWGIQSPINLGMLLRVAEAYSFSVSIFDSHGIFADNEKLRTVEDFACGAYSRQSYTKLDSLNALAKLRGERRLICTVIDDIATSLDEFEFHPNDLIVFGNEYDGLPQEVVGLTDEAIRIPLSATWLPKPRSHSPIDVARSTDVARDGQPSLNVAVSAALVCYSAFTQWMEQRPITKTPAMPHIPVD